MSEKIKKKRKQKPKPIKKVPLTMGIMFMLLGAIFLVFVFTSSDPVTKSAYAVVAVALLASGTGYLDKSGVLER